MTARHAPWVAGAATAALAGLLPAPGPPFPVRLFIWWPWAAATAMALA